MQPGKVIDEFTDLPVSRQRKWQLRHPEKSRVIKNRYEHTDARRSQKREWARRKRQNAAG